MSRIHIYPLEDIQEHVTTMDCECSPKVGFNVKYGEIVVHNAFDGRELIEQAEIGLLPE